MFGNLVNKNARVALKEYGDQNGATVQYDISNLVNSPHNPQFTAVATVGERRFDAATATSKREAKEYAADLALRALLQESLGRFKETGPRVESFPSQDSPPKRLPGQPRTKTKKPQLLAPPDKDPVMLLSEYGQKMNKPVKYEDLPCIYPGSYEVQVTVGNETYGPKISSSKKMAKKLAAIESLKELLNWEPKEGLFNFTEGCPEWSIKSSNVPVSQSGESAGTKSVLLNKDPIMLLNEHCQRNQLKISYEHLPDFGPDHKKTFSCRATVGEKSYDPGTGTKKNVAKKNAALNALKGLFDMPVELGRWDNNSCITGQRHPVSLLNEYGQKNNVKIEFEDMGHSGPDHGRTYMFRAVVGGKAFDSGHGRNKKEARKEASSIALKGLGYQLTPDNLKSEPLSDQQESSLVSPAAATALCNGKSYISALYEFCQAYHYPPPEPVEVQPEGTFDPMFHYAAFKVGKVQYASGAGRTKKMARDMAAKHAINSLSKAKGSESYALVGSEDGDRFAALSWNYLSQLSRCTPEGWRFAGYKCIAAFIMQDGDEDLGTVVSLGSGNKCVSGDRLQLDGTTVHDSHAEVIARRSLLRFFHHHLGILFSHKTDVKCIFVQKKRQGKIQLRDGVKFHLYVSTVPCGDAAIFVNETTNSSDSKLTRAASGAIQQNLLRTKVEKGERTMPINLYQEILTLDGIKSGQRLRTASCSDKIAKWNVLGVQGALLSIVLEPVYITSITLGNLFDAAHLSRAVSLRVEHDNDNTFSEQLPGTYHVNHPKLECGRLAAQRSREDETKIKTKVLTMNWSAVDDETVEVYDGCVGRLALGSKPSRLSRSALFTSLKEVIKNSRDQNHHKLLDAQTYATAKQLAVDYQATKEMLYQRLQAAGYGSWGMMRKPSETSQFS